MGDGQMNWQAQAIRVLFTNEGKVRSVLHFPLEEVCSDLLQMVGLMRLISLVRK